MHRVTLVPTLSALTLALALTPLAPAAAAPSPTPSSEAGAGPSPQRAGAEAPPEVTDRMIVKYRTPVPGAESERVVEKAAEQVRVPEAAEATEVRSTSDGAAVVELSEEVPTEKAEELAAELAKDPAVDYAEPDRLVSVARVPGEDDPEPTGSVAATAQDPGVPSLWALANLRAYEAWDTATGRGVTIGVVDTGFASHPDLDSKVIGGYDFVSGPNLGNDGNGRDADARDPGTYSSPGQCYAGSPATNSIWHGTHVAGSAAARRDNYGTVGVAPDATLLNARALGACGYGYVSDMADAVRWLAGDAVGGAPAPAKRADVINMSLSMPGACSPLLQNAIRTATSRNIPVAVAAGNAGADALGYAPGNCYDVVTVGAIDSGRNRASYSNYGWVVDIYAPGHHILSSGNTGTRGPAAPNTRFDYGTSMATPHVAGTLALLKQKNPRLTAAQYKQAVLDSGDAWPQLPGGKTLNTHDALYITKGATTARPTAPAQGYATRGAIGALHNRIQGQTGPPTSNETPVAGGARQSFRNGTIYWSAATGAHWVRGGVAGAYQANGTAGGPLGFPRSEERPNGIGGAYQLFQRGKIVWSRDHGAHAIRGAVQGAYERGGSEKGALGYPVSGEARTSTGGSYQVFQRGRIYWSPSTGAHGVKGSIGAAYLAQGGTTGRLGFPRSGETTRADRSVVQNFQRGTITWRPGGSIRVDQR